MMKKLILMALVCWQTVSLSAQEFSRDYWHNGEVDLFSGETFTGKLKYDLEKDNIMIQSFDGITRSFSAQKVQSFQFFDALVRIPRYFYALPFEKRAGYASPVFFELLSEGGLSLLNRERISQRSIYYPSFAGGWTTTTLVLEDEYYVLNQTSEKVYRYDPSQHQLPDMFPNRREAIAKFIRDKKIHLNERNDLIRVFEFYNNGAQE